jgi:hypothetical protein
VVTTVEETTAEERQVVAVVVGLSISTPAFGDQANRYLPVATLSAGSVIRSGWTVPAGKADQVPGLEGSEPAVLSGNAGACSIAA